MNIVDKESIVAVIRDYNQIKQFMKERGRWEECVKIMDEAKRKCAPAPYWWLQLLFDPGRHLAYIFGGCEGHKKEEDNGYICMVFRVPNAEAAWIIADTFAEHTEQYFQRYTT